MGGWSSFRAYRTEHRRATWVDYILFYVLAAVIGGGLAGLLGLRVGLGTRRQYSGLSAQSSAFKTMDEFQWFLLVLVGIGVLTAWLVLTIFLLVKVPRELAWKEGIELRIEKANRQHDSWISRMIHRAQQAPKPAPGDSTDNPAPKEASKRPIHQPGEDGSARE